MDTNLTHQVFYERCMWGRPYNQSLFPMSSVFLARREPVSSLTPLENTVRFCLTRGPKVRKVAFSETFGKRYPWSEGDVLLVVVTG